MIQFLFCELNQSSEYRLKGNFRIIQIFLYALTQKFDLFSELLLLLLGALRDSFRSLAKVRTFA